MTTNSHQRKRAKALATARAKANALRIASNLVINEPSPTKASATVASLKAGNRAFAPNGLATARAPWGDRNTRIVGQAFDGVTRLSGVALQPMGLGRNLRDGALTGAKARKGK